VTRAAESVTRSDHQEAETYHRDHESQAERGDTTMNLGERRRHPGIRTVTTIWGLQIHRLPYCTVVP
jgi:hypothetical protein